VVCVCVCGVCVCVWGVCVVFVCVCVWGVCGVCVCMACVCVCVWCLCVSVWCVCVWCVCVVCVVCNCVGALYCLLYCICHDSCWSRAKSFLFKLSGPTALQIHSVSVKNTSQLMLYGEVISLYPAIRKKHINTLCGQNVALLNVNLGVPRPWRVQCNTTTLIYLLYTHMDM